MIIYIKGTNENFAPQPQTLKINANELYIDLNDINNEAIKPNERLVLILSNQGRQSVSALLLADALKTVLAANGAEGNETEVFLIVDKATVKDVSEYAENLHRALSQLRITVNIHVPKYEDERNANFKYTLRSDEIALEQPTHIFNFSGKKETKIIKLSNFLNQEKDEALKFKPADNRF